MLANRKHLRHRWLLDVGNLDPAGVSVPVGVDPAVFHLHQLDDGATQWNDNQQQQQQLRPRLPRFQFQVGRFGLRPIAALLLSFPINYFSKKDGVGLHRLVSFLNRTESVPSKKKNKKNKELTPDQFIKNRIKLISKMRPRTCNEVFIDQTIFTYNLSIVQGSK